jgi:hypothetical protein
LLQVSKNWPGDVARGPFESIPICATELKRGRTSVHNVDATYYMQCTSTARCGKHAVDVRTRTYGTIAPIAVDTRRSKELALRAAICT